MLDRAVKRSEFFNCGAVLDVKRRFEAGGDDTLAWRIASAEAWYETMVEQPRTRAAAAAEISSISW